MSKQILEVLENAVCIAANVNGGAFVTWDGVSTYFMFLQTNKIGEWEKVASMR